MRRRTTGNETNRARWRSGAVRLTTAALFACGAWERGPARATAQEVTVRIVDRITARPVAGALVTLLNERDSIVARALASDAGVATLEAPAPGRYRLRADRIGQRGFATEPLSLRTHETRRLVIAMASEPVVLPELAVAEASRCRALGRAGPAVAQLWDEAAKALRASVSSTGRPLPGFQAITYQRRLTPGLTVISERTDTIAMPRVTRPFRAVPIDQLARHGFIERNGDGFTFFGPDEEVILSEWFLATHCFTVSERRIGRERQAGLSFRPVPGRSAPSLIGTMWLDAATALLRSIDFSYVNLPDGIASEGLAGRIDFAQHPSGIWYVQRWFIRVPVTRPSSVDVPDVRQMRARKVVGFTEDGGKAEPGLHDVT